MNLFEWKKKPLKTVLKVEKGERSFLLVGTAHFFPYSFKKSFTKLIKPAQVILFEGPLDSESMNQIAEYGRKGEGTPSLYEALEREAIAEINRQIYSIMNKTSIHGGSSINLFYPRPSDFLRILLEGVRPWFGFFSVWSLLLNWRYSMDMEAYQIAEKFKKRVIYLETIQEQLEALDGIPFERIVRFINHIGKWKEYQKGFLQTFLSGDLDSFVSFTEEFPTRCDSIVTRRDPIFFQKIKTISEKEKGVAFIGVIHLPGIKKMFLNEGYQVIQEKV